MAKNLKLNQVIAIANGEKSRHKATITKVYQILEKDTLFNGFTRRYRPLEDEGEKLPPEDKNVQNNVKDSIAEAVTACTSLFNVVATQDKANTTAKANIVVNDVVVASDVPVTTLLFLEKQLEDQLTFISKLPVLDAAEKWQADPATSLFRAEAKQVNRTKKIPRNHQVAKATDHHPEQVQVYHEDVTVGTFEVTNLSGAIPKQEKNELLERVRQLQKAVKFAREEANMIEISTESDLGQKVLGFIYKK